MTEDPSLHDAYEGLVRRYREDPASAVVCARLYEGRIDELVVLSQQAMSVVDATSAMRTQESEIRAGIHRILEAVARRTPNRPEAAEKALLLYRYELTPEESIHIALGSDDVAAAALRGVAAAVAWVTADTRRQLANVARISAAFAVDPGALAELDPRAAERARSWPPSESPDVRRALSPFAGAPTHEDVAAACDALERAHTHRVGPQTLLLLAAAITAALRLQTERTLKERLFDAGGAATCATEASGPPLAQAFQAMAKLSAALGRTSDALHYIDAVRRSSPTETVLIEAIQSEADLYWDAADHEGGIGVLEDAIASLGADNPATDILLQKLVSMWTHDAPGLAHHVERLARVAERTPPPDGYLYWITVAQARKRLGDDGAVREALTHLDPAKLAATLPAPFVKQMVAIVDELRGAPSRIGLDEAKRHADAGRWTQAAEAAEEAAEPLRDFPSRAAECFAYGASLWQKAGDFRKAYRDYQTALDLLERTHRGVPLVSAVLTSLSRFPGLYAGAAAAAIDSGHLSRALEWAEAGRFRVMGALVGGRLSVGESATTDPDVRALRKTWRRLALVGASKLVDAEQSAERAELERTFRRLRLQLSRRGEGIDAELAPGTPASPEAIQEGLRRQGAPAVAVYSIRKDDGVRFLIVTSAIIEEVEVSRDAARSLVAGCDAYVQRMRNASPDNAELDARVDEVIASAERAVEAVVTAALRRAPEHADTPTPIELLFVPHGSLAALPLAACRFDGGHVADRFACRIACALGMAGVLDAPLELGRSTVSIRGDYEVNEPSTEGGIAVLRAVDSSVEERTPSSIEELVSALRDKSIVFAGCHGELFADKPLSSNLRFFGSFRPTLETLADELEGRDRLWLLGACDSGALLQSENNEALGIPIALAAGGAQTVIGASWPVPRIAAAAVCARFVRELDAGRTSPAALRFAQRWARDATGKELLAFFAEIDHPLKSVTQLGKLPRPCGAARAWGAFAHWGRVVRLRSS